MLVLCGEVFTAVCMHMRVCVCERESMQSDLPKEDLPFL